MGYIKETEEDLQPDVSPSCKPTLMQEEDILAMQHANTHAVAAQEEDLTSAQYGDADAPSTSGRPQVDLERLKLENERLVLENQLLRENMRLTLENKRLAEAAGASFGRNQGTPTAQLVEKPVLEQRRVVSSLPSSHRSAVQHTSPLAVGLVPTRSSSTSMVNASTEHPTMPMPHTTVSEDSRIKKLPKQGPIVVEDETECEIPEAERTTVMLRNLPNNYTRRMLVELLDSEGFAGKYDFLYLPIDFKSRACLGYAFINLLSPVVVPLFWKTFHGYSRWILPSKKISSVSWSGPHQGFEAHVSRYRNSPVMHDSVPDEYKPVIFCNGTRMCFPPPTKSPRAPRARNQPTTTGKGASKAGKR